MACVYGGDDEEPKQVRAQRQGRQQLTGGGEALSKEFRLGGLALSTVRYVEAFNTGAVPADDVEHHLIQFTEFRVATAARLAKSDETISDKRKLSFTGSCRHAPSPT